MVYKSSVVFLLMGTVAYVWGEKYTEQYDDINLDEIFTNERLYRIYFKCILSTGKCTPEGEVLKKAIPDALKNECSKCSDKQKAGVEKVLKFLLTKKPEDYKILESQFDSEGVYKKKYEALRKQVEVGKPIAF